MPSVVKIILFVRWFAAFIYHFVIRAHMHTKHSGKHEIGMNAYSEQKKNDELGIIFPSMNGSSICSCWKTLEHRLIRIWIDRSGFVMIQWTGCLSYSLSSPFHSLRHWIVLNHIHIDNGMHRTENKKISNFKCWTILYYIAMQHAPCEHYTWIVHRGADVDTVTPCIVVE